MDNKIHSIALIASDNSPLYVRTFVDQSVEAQLKTQFLVHTSLDLIGDRVSSKQPEQYLGLLFTQEDVGVYAFQTVTKIKILVMVLLTESVVRDLDVVTVFRAIYHNYLSYVSNPFNDLSFTSVPTPEITKPITNRPIRSRAFDRQMELVAGSP